MGEVGNRMTRADSEGVEVFNKVFSREMTGTET